MIYSIRRARRGRAEGFLIDRVPNLARGSVRSSWRYQDYRSVTRDTNNIKLRPPLCTVAAAERPWPLRRGLQQRGRHRRSSPSQPSRRQPGGTASALRQGAYHLPSDREERARGFWQ